MTTRQDLDQAFRVFATAYEKIHGVPDSDELALEGYNPEETSRSHRWRVVLRDKEHGTVHTPSGSRYFMGNEQAYEALRFAADVLWATQYEHAARR